MSKEFVIGLDIGTTSVKACLFDLRGHVLAEAENMNTFFYPQPGWAEQNPQEIEQSAVQALKEVIEKAGVQVSQLLAVGFSAAMHSLVCMDSELNPLSPALIWADGRSHEQAERLLAGDGYSLYAKTGTPIHPMTPFLKLLWMKETGYEPYQQAAYFMSIKEYMIYRWFGEQFIDYSMASATGLFNPSTLNWEAELLELAGVKEEQLSRIVPPTTILPAIRADVAAEMGIPQDLPFVIGAADGQLANLGIGAILPGEVAVSAGTSGAIRQVTHGTVVNEKHETFCYAFTADTSIIGGATNNGGIALQWAKDLLDSESSFPAFLQKAEHVPPGAEGILFLPYVNGERAPLWNQRAKGNFYGVTLAHRKEHFIRAVLEGITFNLYQIGKALERLAGAPKCLYVNGGLARSPLWLQMLADIFDAEVQVSESHHSAAWGAAWMALLAIERVETLGDIKKNIPAGNRFYPDEENSARYQEIYQQYEQLVRDITKHF
ncbi:gluconokinase [Ectobacillus ponti]|uniref:Gluconokinase n=1 Tax=Ectobacillus ponti TaxID=2961894 RepID=A0AA41XBQ6_9BACI|nr:gluconokinase [Ectobacillus ponti]MCP8970520.1 gluconokinase [Ectobacillus ponti]